MAIDIRKVYTVINGAKSLLNGFDLKQTDAAKKLVEAIVANAADAATPADAPVKTCLSGLNDSEKLEACNAIIAKLNEKGGNVDEAFNAINDSRKAAERTRPSVTVAFKEGQLKQTIDLEKAGIVLDKTKLPKVDGLDLNLSDDGKTLTLELKVPLKEAKDINLNFTGAVKVDGADDPNGVLPIQIKITKPAAAPVPEEGFWKQWGAWCTGGVGLLITAASVFFSDDDAKGKNILTAIGGALLAGSAVAKFGLGWIMGVEQTPAPTTAPKK